MKYHMMKSEREITDSEEIKRILRDGKYTVIAMCRDNEPYVVSLSYGYDDANNILYFHSRLKGLKFDFMNENPRVCATVIKDLGYNMNDCSHSYASVVMWGEMSVVNELEEKKRGMDILLKHLEENPDPIKNRIFKNDEVYSKISIMRLRVDEITGKKGS